MDRDIHKLAALITEDVDEYMDLGDIGDEDAFKAPQASGYACGDGCWEYEEMPLTIGGQMYLGRAALRYDADIDAYPGSPATRFDPGEQAHLEVDINGYQVKEFEIYDNQGNTLVHWVRREPLAGDLSEEQIQAILDQIGEQFEADEQKVIEYLEENYDPQPDPRYDY